MTPRAPAAGAPESGFTLLEVVVALAILSIAIVASIQGFAQGLRLLKTAGDHQQAMLLADQKIREVLVPAEEKQSGTEGAFTWERTITVDPTPELERSRATAAWTIYRIAVRVGWGDRSHVELVTLRASIQKAVTR
jgi:general secretion pathway protein I